MTRNTEPHQKCSSSAPAISGPSAAIAPPSADQSAIERVRPGPDQSAVISASVVGNAIPAERPPSRRATKQDLDRGRVGGEQACRDRETDAEDEHHLAAVAVAERTEPEDRRRQAERVADRDEVEAGLAGVEVLADLGQGDVGDGEVQVGDRGDEDEREQHEALPVGRRGLLVPADARGLSHREDPKG